MFDTLVYYAQHYIQELVSHKMIAAELVQGITRDWVCLRGELGLSVHL